MNIFDWVPDGTNGKSVKNMYDLIDQYNLDTFKDIMTNLRHFKDIGQEVDEKEYILTSMQTAVTELSTLMGLEFSPDASFAEKVLRLSVIGEMTVEDTGETAIDMYAKWMAVRLGTTYGRELMLIEKCDKLVDMILDAGQDGGESVTSEDVIQFAANLREFKATVTGDEWKKMELMNYSPTLPILPAIEKTDYKEVTLEELAEILVLVSIVRGEELEHGIYNSYTDKLELDYDESEEAVENAKRLSKSMFESNANEFSSGPMDNIMEGL